jgi:hypothetical protein
MLQVTLCRFFSVHERERRDLGFRVGTFDWTLLGQAYRP